MTCKITYSKRFLKSYQKLTKNEKRIVKNKLNMFVNHPFHPSLRTKKIRGLENTFELSVNMSIRVIWFYQNDKIIVLLEVGHHDILDKL